MDIGIFGHSIASWDRKEPWSYVTKLQKHFNANLVNIGVNMCSEERILFQLKKVKKIDIAIIFHCNPLNCFIPSWDRDAHTADREILEKKFNLIKGAKLNKILEQSELMEEYVEQVSRFKNVPNDESHIISSINSLHNTDNMPVYSVLSEIAKKQNINFYDFQDTMDSSDKEKFTKELLDTCINDDIFLRS